MNEDTGRSTHRVDDADLDRLAGLATVDEQDLFPRRPEGAGRYTGRLIGRALCQGAALHLLDGRNGIKDFEVWSFYAARTDGPYPARRVGRADFGPSPFGTWPGDAGRFTGRRVDLIGRSIAADVGEDPLAAIRRWLTAGSSSARLLAMKAVVLVEPTRLCGAGVWPVREPDGR